VAVSDAATRSRAFSPGSRRLQLGYEYDLGDGWEHELVVDAR